MMPIWAHFLRLGVEADVADRLKGVAPLSAVAIPAHPGPAR